MSDWIKETVPRNWMQSMTADEAMQLVEYGAAECTCRVDGDSFVLRITPGKTAHQLRLDLAHHLDAINVLRRDSVIDSRRFIAARGRLMAHNEVVRTAVAMREVPVKDQIGVIMKARQETP